MKTAINFLEFSIPCVYRNIKLFYFETPHMSTYQEEMYAFLAEKCEPCVRFGIPKTTIYIVIIK
jgi:hypothetical protein